MMDRLLENNTVLKILSVIVAIFIWFQAGAGSNQLQNRILGSVAVGFPTLNPRLTVLSISPATVTVQIKGLPATVGSNTIANEVSASIKLSNITRPGTYSLKVTGSVPPGVGVVNVTPNRVVVSVAQLGRQKVPVVAHITGQPASGDELIGYKSNLTQALISGPTGQLNQVRSVTGTLNIAGRSSRFSQDVLLYPINSRGAVVPKVQVYPPTARITANIQVKPPQKIVPVVGQISGKTATGYSVSNIAVYPSSVTLSGTRSTLKGINRIDTTPIDVTGKTGNISVSVPVVVPKGTTLVSSGEVTVTVTIAPTG